MTNPTLERAARAAYEAWIDDVRDLEPAWDDLPESHRDRLVGSTRAMLMAVREPDMRTRMVGRNAMTGTTVSPFADYSVVVGEGFTAMIDEISRQDQ